MLKGILVMSCIHPCVQLFMGLALCIADKSLGRNGQQIGMLMYPDDLCSAWFVGILILTLRTIQSCPPISPFHGSDHWRTNIFCWWNIHKSVGSYLYSKLDHLYVRRTWHILQWPRCNFCRYCIAWLSTMSSSTHKVRPQRWPLCNF